MAKKHNADIIIMGSHGSSGLEEFFVGSNTEKVVRTSDIPVLVIKNDSDFEAKKAVFACDFKTESIESFKKTITIFEALDIEMHLVYINLPGIKYLRTQEIEKQIVDFIIHLTDCKLLPEDITIYSDYSVEKGVFNYAKKNEGRYDQYTNAWQTRLGAFLFRKYRRRHCKPFRLACINGQDIV